MAAILPVPPANSVPGRRGRNWRTIWRDVRGVAALEFGLIVPVFVTASIGIYAVAQGLRVRLLLGTATTSMVDIVASQSSVTPVTLKDFCSGGAINSMLPYDTQVVVMTVARYVKPPGGPATGPDWTYKAACPKDGPPIGAAEVNLANTVLVNEGDVVIIAKANYPFKPSINGAGGASSYYVPAATLSVTRYQIARNTGKAACTGC